MVLQCRKATAKTNIHVESQMAARIAAKVKQRVEQALNSPEIQTMIEEKLKTERALLEEKVRNIRAHILMSHTTSESGVLRRNSPCKETLVSILQPIPSGAEFQDLIPKLHCRRHKNCTALRTMLSRLLCLGQLGINKPSF